MDSRQARQILELYRPTVDDADPQFAEALAFAQNDAELRAWLAEQHASYEAVRDKLRDMPVPAGLREQILAQRKVVRVPAAWWARPQLWQAVAAVAVICFSLYLIGAQLHWWDNTEKAQRSFAAFRGQMTYFAAAGYKLDVTSASLDELRQQFASHGWPADYVVPAGLTKLIVRGGCLSKWQAHKVSMLCLSSADKHGVWLYVVDQKAVPDAPKQSTPQFKSEGTMATASWSKDGETYLLTAEGNEAYLRTLL